MAFALVINLTDSFNPMTKEAQPRKFSGPEALETRIAPAVLTLIDVDGDTITIQTNKGTNADLDAAVIRAAPTNDFPERVQILAINLAGNPVFKGTNLTVLAGTANDELRVNVGAIDATGLDIGNVLIDGDLGQIDAGDSNSRTAGVKGLTVYSMGANGIDTQAPGGSLESRIVGKLNSLTVQSDFDKATIFVLGVDPDPFPETNDATDSRGMIGAIKIGGNVIGGDDENSGLIYAKGNVGNVSIGGSVMGGNGASSGSIITERNMGRVSITGDVTGGTDNLSGRIFAADTMGAVTIGGNLVGGDGIQSGNVTSGANLGSVTVSGFIQGGLGYESGAIGSGGRIGKVTVEGNITGGEGERSGSILSTSAMLAVRLGGDLVGGGGDKSGLIGSDLSIASLTVNGSIIGGGGFQSGAVGSLLPLGAVKVMKDVIGGDGDKSGQIVSSKTIKSVSIEGNVIGGDGEESGAIGSNDRLGPVEIKGNLQGGLGFRSGLIASGTNIPSVKIGGNIVGGGATSSGAIISEGAIGKVEVKGSVFGGEFFYSGAITAARGISNVAIGGRLVGGYGPSSGAIQTFGDSESAISNIGGVTIGGAIEGGDGFNSGAVYASGKLGKVTAASLVGGLGEFSGQIGSGDSIGTVKITGDVEGSSANGGGIIFSGKDIAVLDIGGSLIGSAGSFNVFLKGTDFMGQVFVNGTLGTARIGGDLLGGSGLATAQIRAADIKRVLIEGDVDAAAAHSASIIAYSGSIGLVEVRGEFRGADSFHSGWIGAQESIATVKLNVVSGGIENPVSILATKSIKSVTVADRAVNMNILAGYDYDGNPVNRDASIGTVLIGVGNGAGTIEATNIVAGAEPGGGQMGDGVFGTTDDLPIGLFGTSPIDTRILSKISKIIIRGGINNASTGFHSYGIVAEQIGSVKIGSQNVKLEKGGRNDFITNGGMGGEANFGSVTINEMELALGII